MNKYDYLKVNCPHCGFQAAFNLGDFKSTDLLTCNSEEGGCDTKFVVTVHSSTKSESGVYVQTIQTSAHKIEGITPDAPPDGLPVKIWQDFVVIQAVCDNDDFGAKLEIIEKSQLAEERRRATEATGGNCGIRVISEFQALIENQEGFACGYCKTRTIAAPVIENGAKFCSGKCAGQWKTETSFTI